MPHKAHPESNTNSATVASEVPRGLQQEQHKSNVAIAPKKPHKASFIFPASLVSLDIAFNDITDLANTIAAFKGLPNLKSLYLQVDFSALVEPILILNY